MHGYWLRLRPDDPRSRRLREIVYMLEMGVLISDDDPNLFVSALVHVLAEKLSFDDDAHIDVAMASVADGVKQMKAMLEARGETKQ
jgi:hypothetical protein